MTQDKDIHDPFEKFMKKLIDWLTPPKNAFRPETQAPSGTLDRFQR